MEMSRDQHSGQREEQCKGPGVDWRGELYKVRKVTRGQDCVRPCRPRQEVGISLMARHWTIVSRGLADYDYHQLFLVTSFLPASRVHSEFDLEVG